MTTPINGNTKCDICLKKMEEGDSTVHKTCQIWNTVEEDDHCLERTIRGLPILLSTFSIPLMCVALTSSSLYGQIVGYAGFGTMNSLSLFVWYKSSEPG